MNLWGFALGLLGFIAAAAAGFFAYLSQRRKTSGRVPTTEAEVLWQESSAIRREAVERAQMLQGQLDDLRDAHTILERKCIDQDREIADLRKENNDNHRVMTIMRNELIELRSKLGMPPNHKLEDDDLGQHA